METKEVSNFYGQAVTVAKIRETTKLDHAEIELRAAARAFQYADLVTSWLRLKQAAVNYSVTLVSTAVEWKDK